MLHDAGVDCAVLERDATPLGSSALSSGFIPAPGTQAQRAVVCEVAALLGNTPAVCRKAYIDPSVFDGWERGELVALAGLRGPRQWEQATLRYLRRARRVAAKVSRSKPR